MAAAQQQQAQRAEGKGGSEGGNAAPAKTASPAEFKNVGRNDSCPCGSGKKFKNCHGG
jgi:preprotein translocase subunit SecA